MTPSMRVALAALVCVMLPPGLASAQDDSFKQGLQARGDRKWPDTARAMRAAIQKDSQESTRKVRSGIGALIGQGTEYLPFYFLGEALKNQGDCAGAVSAWAASESQKVVQTKEEYWANLQRGYRECAAKGVLLPSEYNAQLSASQKAYEEASALARRITDLGAAHRDQWLPLANQYDAPHKELQAANARLTVARSSRSASDFAEVRAASERAMVSLRSLGDALDTAIAGDVTLKDNVQRVERAIDDAGEVDKAIDALNVSLDPSSTGSRNAARQQLAQARLQLGAAAKTRNAVAVNDAMKTVQTASATLTQVLEQLQRTLKQDLAQRVGEAVRRADEAFASVSALMATLDRRAAQKSDKVTSDMTTQRDGLQKQIETLRRRFDRARTKQDVAGLDDVTVKTRETQATLDMLIQAFGPVTLRDRGVHAALEDGANLFLRGEYEKALAALDPSTGVGDSALQLHVHLFRAASLYQLYVRSGERQQDLRAKALEEIAQCKQISSMFEPDARVFAPRFITLYKTGGAVAPQTAAAARQP
jgi:predicted  nucleic acid-binding Zn-ribbon protein